MTQGVSRIIRTIRMPDQVVTPRSFPREGEEVIFNLPGELLASESGRWYSRRFDLVDEWIVSLAVAGTSDTIVDFKKNGASEFTVTLASGELYELAVDGNGDERSISVRPFEDYITIEITTAGTAAEDLTVQGFARKESP